MARYAPRTAKALCESCGHDVFRHLASTHMHWLGATQVADGFCTVTGRGRSATPCLCESAAPVCPCGEDSRDESNAFNAKARAANREWVLQTWSRK